MSSRVWVPSLERSRRQPASRRSSPRGPIGRRRRRGSLRSESRRKDPVAIAHPRRRPLSASTSKNHNRESRFQPGVRNEIKSLCVFGNVDSHRSTSIASIEIE